MLDRSPIQVLIVDDHPVVREGLAALIGRRTDMQVVAEAADGPEALQCYRRHQPDVVLMDLRLSTSDGVEVIAQIQSEHPGARIIILTTYAHDEGIYRGFQAGAMAYLLKDAPREELLDTIRAVHLGQRRIPPEIGARLTEHLSRSQLSAREQQVLQLIADGYSNKEVGMALSISEGTVKAHVNSILTKLDASDRTQAVVTALRRGIIQLS